MSILAAIGSIYVSIFGICQMVNNYLTKNSEDIAMANKLYKVKITENVNTEGQPLEQVLKNLQNKKSFEFSPFYQLM